MDQSIHKTASANNGKFRFVRIPPKDDHSSFPSSRVYPAEQSMGNFSPMNIVINGYSSPDLMLNSVRIRPQGYSNHGGNARPIPRANTLIFSRRMTPSHCPSSENNAISPEAMDNLPAVSDFFYEVER